MTMSHFLRFCPAFDFVAFDVPSGNGKTKITKDDLCTLFVGGKRALARANAVPELMERMHCGMSAAYNALKADGRFGEHLSEADGLLSWKP
jgi:hypothetical protein